MASKYSDEFKLRVVRAGLDLGASFRAARAFGLQAATVLAWSRDEKLVSEAGKRDDLSSGTPLASVLAFKVRVVRDAIKSYVAPGKKIISKPRLNRILGVSQDFGIPYEVAESWCRDDKLFKMARDGLLEEMAARGKEEAPAVSGEEEACAPCFVDGGDVPSDVPADGSPFDEGFIALGGNLVPAGDSVERPEPFDAAGPGSPAGQLFPGFSADAPAQGDNVFPGPSGVVPDEPGCASLPGIVSDGEAGSSSGDHNRQKDFICVSGDDLWGDELWSDGEPQDCWESDAASEGKASASADGKGQEGLCPGDSPETAGEKPCCPEPSRLFSRKFSRKSLEKRLNRAFRDCVRDYEDPDIDGPVNPVLKSFRLGSFSGKRAECLGLSLLELVRDGDRYAVRDALGLAHEFACEFGFGDCSGLSSYRAPAIVLVSSIILHVRFGDCGHMSVDDFLRTMASDLELSSDVLSSSGGGFLFGTDACHYYRITREMYDAEPGRYEGMLFDGVRGSGLVERDKDGNVVRNGLVGMPLRASAVERYLSFAVDMFRMYADKEREVVVWGLLHGLALFFDNFAVEKDAAKVLSSLGEKERGIICRWKGISDADKFFSDVLAGDRAAGTGSD